MVKTDKNKRNKSDNWLDEFLFIQKDVKRGRKGKPRHVINS